MCPKFSNTKLTIPYPDCRRGVAIFVREELQVGVIIPTNNYRPWIETVWLTISIENDIINFGYEYCSPSSLSQIISKNALLEIVSDTLKIKSFETIIVDDFTCQKSYGLMDHQKHKLWVFPLHLVYQTFIYTKQ